MDEQLPTKVEADNAKSEQAPEQKSAERPVAAAIAAAVGIIIAAAIIVVKQCVFGVFAYEVTATVLGMFAAYWIAVAVRSKTKASIAWAVVITLAAAVEIALWICGF